MLAGGILQVDVSKIPNKSEELSAAIRVTVNNDAEFELEQQTVNCFLTSAILPTAIG